MCVPCQGEFCAQISLGNTGSREGDSQREKCKQYFPRTRDPFSHTVSTGVSVVWILVWSLVLRVSETHCKVWIRNRMCSGCFRKIIIASACGSNWKRMVRGWDG